MEPQNTVNREGFQKFLDFCNNALIEDSKPLEIMKLIRKRHKECNEEFLESEEFYELLITSHAKILGDRGKFFVYLKEFLNILKQNRRTISKSDKGIKRCLDTDNSSDSDSDQQSKCPRLSGYIREGSCSDDNACLKTNLKSYPKSTGSGSKIPDTHVSSRQSENSESVTNCECESQDDKDMVFERNLDIDKDSVKQQADVNILSDHKDNEEKISDHDSDLCNDNVGEQSGKESESEINRDIGNQSKENLCEENDAFEDEAVIAEKQSDIDVEQEQVEVETVNVQRSTHYDSDIILDSGHLESSGQFDEAQTVFKPQKDQEYASTGTGNAEENLNTSVQILEEEFEQAILTMNTDIVKPVKNTKPKSFESSENESIEKEKFPPQLDSDHDEQSSETELTFKSGNKDKYTSWISQARSKFKTMKNETDSSNDERGVNHFHRTHTGKRKYSSSGSSDEDYQYRKETKQRREKIQKKYKISVGKSSNRDKDKYSQLDHKTKKTSPKDKLSPRKTKDTRNSPKKSPSFSLHKSPILIVTDSESEEEKPRSLTPLDEEFCAEKRQLFGIKRELKVKIEKIKTESVVIKDEIPNEDYSEFNRKGDTDSEQPTKAYDNISDVKENISEVKEKQDLTNESDHEEVKTKSDGALKALSHDKDDKTESKHAKKRVALVTEVLFEKTKQEEIRLESRISNSVENTDRKVDSDNEDFITDVVETKSLFPTEQKYPPKRNLEKESSDVDEKDSKDNNSNVKDVSKSRKEDDDNVQPSTSGESSHSNPKIVKGSVKQVMRLEKLLEQIRDKIENVRNRELDLDDLNSNVSDYILEDRLQQKFITVWKKLCELHNSATSTGRPTEKYFKYQGTRYPDVNKKIEKFVNKKKVFPDYHDVRNIIVKVNKDKKLHLRPKMIDDLAREAFTDVGNKLQRRRKRDFRENIDTQDISLYSVYDDPALYDTDLKKKLDANKRAAKSSIEKVVDKYARLQYEEGDPDEDDGINYDNEDEEENNEEDEEEEDLIESPGNQSTKEIDQDVILLLEEDEEKLDTDDEEGRTKQNNEVDPKLTVPFTKVKQEPKKLQPENSRTFSDGKSQYFGEMFGLQNTQPKPQEQIKTACKETVEGTSNISKEPVKTHEGSIPKMKKGDDKPSVVTGATKAPVKSHQSALPAFKTGVQKPAIDTAAVCKQVTDILTKEFSQGVIEINSDEEENAQPKPPDKSLIGCPILEEPAKNTIESKTVAKETNVNIESVKGNVKKDNRMTEKSESHKEKVDDLIVIDLDEDDVQIIDENLGAQSQFNADEYYDYANDDNQYYDQSHYDNQYYENQYYQTDLYEADYKKKKEKDKKSTRRTSGWHYETPALNLKITSPRHISVNDHLSNTNKQKSYHNGSKVKVDTLIFRKGNPEKVKTSALQSIPKSKVVEKIDLTSSDCIEIDLDDNEDKNNSQINQNNSNSVSASGVNGSNSKEILICDSPKDSPKSSPNQEEKQNVDVSENTGRDSVTVIDQDDDVKVAGKDHSDDNDSSVKLIEESATSKEEESCEILADTSTDIVSVSDKTDSGTTKGEKALESLDNDEEKEEVDEGEESELEEGEIIYPEEGSAGSSDDDDGSDQSNEKELKCSFVERQKQVDYDGEESNASSDKFVAIPLKLYDDSEQVHDMADEFEKECEENDHVEYDDDEKLDDFGDQGGSCESDLKFDQPSNDFKASNSVELCLSKVNMEDISEKNDAASYESNPDIFDDGENVDSLRKIDESNASVTNTFGGKDNVKLNRSEENIITDDDNSNDLFDDGRDCVDNEICPESHENSFGENLIILDDKDRIANKNDTQHIEQVTYNDADNDISSQCSNSSQCSESLLSGTLGITNFKSSKTSPHETKTDKETGVCRTIENDVEICENILSSSPTESFNNALEITENKGAQVNRLCSENRKLKFNNEHDCLFVGEGASPSNDKHDSVNVNDMEVSDYSDCEEVDSASNDGVQKAISILDDKSDNKQGEVTSKAVISNSVEEAVTRTSVGNSSVIKLKQPEVRNKLMKLKNAIKTFPKEAYKKPNKESVNSEAKSSSLFLVEDKHMELIEGYEEPELYISKKGDKLVSSLVEEIVELSDSD